MKRLCRRLDLKLWQAVGIMESLWHLTARECPRGNIGKLSDEDIALGIDWDGEPSILIAALLSSGWLDPTERLGVHDWHEHADDAVQSRIARAKLHFVGGFSPKLTKLGKAEREEAQTFYRNTPGIPPAEYSGSLPEPLPLPLPEPCHNQSPATTTTVGANGAPRLPMMPTANSEYPEIMAVIRQRDPAVNESFVRGLVDATVQHCLSSREFPHEKIELLTDANIARCVEESYRTWVGRKAHGTGLLLNRVPNIAVSAALAG